ncbi:MAG: hypothetical protein CSA33_09200 [Desulfobulbus propionicus]|nr:MAG: hypothetical protein CSA33_09200 [Desulfobulbus propionicus]
MRFKRESWVTACFAYASQDGKNDFFYLSLSGRVYSNFPGLATKMIGAMGNPETTRALSIEAAYPLTVFWKRNRLSTGHTF